MNQNQALAILITGMPGSGKTTLSHQLAALLECPIVSKDTIKELLFDHLGGKDRVWSQKIGAASFELLYQQIEKLAKAHSTFLVDCDFSNVELASQKLTAIHRTCRLNYFEVALFCDGKILSRRFKSRVEDRTRHPGHSDQELVQSEEFQGMLQERKRADLAIPVERIHIDSSDPSRINPQELAKQIREARHQQMDRKLSY